MFPTLCKIGPLTVHSYGLMMALGFLTSLYFIQREARRAGLDPNVVADLAFWVLLLGLAGARVLHIIMFSDSYSWNDPIGWIAVWRGGLVFQGGPPPAILFGYWYLKRRNMSFWKTVDVGFPYLALGHAFGRIGCFLNGCCYGLPTSLPWGIRFPRVPFDVGQDATGSPPFLDHVQRFSKISMNDQWSLPMHPTQLYEFLALIAICVSLLLLRKYWHPFQGFTMPVYFILYGLWRFFNEYLRGDHNPTHVLALSDQQIFSLAFAVLSVVLFFVLKRFQSTKSNL
ncbi:MAG: prolipoprotein diacylglyceryl transferase [Candidatus Hydrogenedentes bacterium]|nr:prolipoprotein diacylglyceryl transferase [Candidatus Hydrogenedentota bacterium]